MFHWTITLTPNDCTCWSLVLSQVRHSKIHIELLVNFSLSCLIYILPFDHFQCALSLFLFQCFSVFLPSLRTLPPMLLVRSVVLTSAQPLCCPIVLPFCFSQPLPSFLSDHSRHLCSLSDVQIVSVNFSFIKIKLVSPTASPGTRGMVLRVPFPPQIIRSSYHRGLTC